MTAQELVNKWIVTMLIFAVLAAIGVIAFVNVGKKETPQHQTPICTVLYLDRNAAGLVVYANEQWECKLK